VAYTWVSMIKLHSTKHSIVSMTHHLIVTDQEEITSLECPMLDDAAIHCNPIAPNIVKSVVVLLAKLLQQLEIDVVTTPVRVVSCLSPCLDRVISPHLEKILQVFPLFRGIIAVLQR
jgi:hypothetical protein